MIGKIISHYKILETLGEGGMGVVYKARSLKLDRLVAIKFLLSHLVTEPEKDRFINEAKSASVLDHPNICTIHEIDETEDGELFIVMSYYQGETLKEKLAGSHLPVEDAIKIAKQVAQGLSRAHEAGIVHRDIKTENVIINRRMAKKLITEQTYGPSVLFCTRCSPDNCLFKASISRQSCIRS